MNYIKFKDTIRKHYIDKNVYVAAKERIKHLIKITDDIFCSFSGGKDSLVCLKLVEEVYQELNINKKINVLFYDEEVINFDIIHFLEKMRLNPKYNFKWICIPLNSYKYQLDGAKKYIQWDKNRTKHMREIPEYAITLEDLNLPPDKVISQYEMSEIAQILFPCEKLGSIRGIRCDESLIRLNGVLSKKKEPYLQNDAHIKTIKICQPIYDWSESDVFLYMLKNKIEYCNTYNNQMWCHEEFRVATDLLPEGRVKLKNLKNKDPEYYEKLQEVFPEMAFTPRYSGEYLSTTKNGLQTKIKQFDHYPHTFEGLRLFVSEKYHDKQVLTEILKQIDIIEKQRNKKINEDPYDIMGGYPLLHLFIAYQDGVVRKIPQRKVDYTLNDFKFEGMGLKEKRDFNNYRVRKAAYKFRGGINE